MIHAKRVRRQASAQPRNGKAELCVNCATPLSARYCPACGERRASERHYSLSHFLAEAVEVFTHADNNLLRTAKLLVTRPGQLTAEFMAGRRKLYLGPLQIFLIMNLLLFLLESYIPHGPFAPTLKEITYSGQPSSLEKVTHSGAPGTLAQRMVAAKLAAGQISPDNLEEKFDHAVKLNSKSMVIIMVPMFALGLALLQIRQRTFFVRHLVFAFHFYAFVMVFGCSLDIFETLLNHLPWYGFKIFAEHYLFVVTFSVVFVYLLSAVSRVYQQSRPMAILKTSFLSVLVFVILYIYRFILFVVTLHSV